MTELLLDGLPVSRETYDRLIAFVASLERWNPAINLVSKSTLPAAWDRHIRDSAQCVPLGGSGRWLDLGSGGGFPGAVVAIILAEHSPERTVTLVEADRRKATFLQTALRDLGVAAEVVVERIELLRPQAAQTVSARALAPLDTLCAYAKRHLDAQGTALFLKGASWKEELAVAKRSWSFEYTVHPSKTDPSSVILAIQGISHA